MMDNNLYIPWNEFKQSVYCCPRCKFAASAYALMFLRYDMLCPGCNTIPMSNYIIKESVVNE